MIDKKDSAGVAAEEYSDKAMAHERASRMGLAPQYHFLAGWRARDNEVREAFEAGQKGRVMCHDYEEREVKWGSRTMTGVMYIPKYETFDDYLKAKGK